MTWTVRDVVWHEHIFSPLADEDGDGIAGRFDAIEEANGKISVLDVENDAILCECRTRSDAVRAAKKAARIWQPKGDKPALPPPDDNALLE